MCVWYAFVSGHWSHPGETGAHTSVDAITGQAIRNCSTIYSVVETQYSLAGPPWLLSTCHPGEIGVHISVDSIIGQVNFELFHNLLCRWQGRSVCSTIYCCWNTIFVGTSALVIDHLCHPGEIVLHTIIDPPFSSSVRNCSTIYSVVETQYSFGTPALVIHQLFHPGEIVLHTIIDPKFSSSVRNRSTIYHVVGQGSSELFHSIIYPVVGQIISEPFCNCPLFGQVSSELFHSIMYPAVGQIISELFHNLPCHWTGHFGTVLQFTMSLGRSVRNCSTP